MRQSITHGVERLRCDFIVALVGQDTEEQPSTTALSESADDSSASGQQEKFGEYQIISAQERHRLDGRMAYFTKGDLRELGIDDKDTLALIRDDSLIERTAYAIRQREIQMFAIAVVTGARGGDQRCLSIKEKYGKAFQYTYKMTWEQAAERS